MTKDIIEEALRNKLAEKKATDSELQRRSSMTGYERGREALDKLTRDVKTHSEKAGETITHDAAQKRATEIAHKAERRKGG